MKRCYPAHRLCLQAAIVGGVLLAASAAQACKKYDYVCKATDRAKKEADDAQHAADDAAREARDAANKAAADAKAAADKAAAEAERLAQQLAKDGAAISKSEMTALLKDARSAYSESDQAVNSGVKAAVDGLQKLINQALEALWRAAGKSQVGKVSKQLLDMKHRAMALDAEGQAALNRVRRAIASKDLDEQGRADMQVLVKAIVYAGKDLSDPLISSLRSTPLRHAMSDPLCILPTS
jgi:vacuolar-type H+-ATPase subunit E/Vma4